MKLTYEYIRDNRFAGPAYAIGYEDDGIQVWSFRHPSQEELQDRDGDDQFDIFNPNDYLDGDTAQWYLDNYQVFDDIIEAAECYKEKYCELLICL